MSFAKAECSSLLMLPAFYFLYVDPYLNLLTFALNSFFTTWASCFELSMEVIKDNNWGCLFSSVLGIMLAFLRKWAHASTKFYLVCS